MSDARKIAEAQYLIDRAIQERAPRRVFALFSGGGDSIIATHIASRHPQFTGCVFVNTGTAIDGVPEHVRRVCLRFGWPLYERQPPEPYEQMIIEAGMPGPGQHGTAYVRLKERTFDAFVREMCSRCVADERHAEHDRVLWISGARRAESKRRMRNARTPIERDGSQVWASILFDWTAADCAAYRNENDLPTSDVAALIHRSGECNCGTYADKGERAMLCSLFPAFRRSVEKWEALALEHGHHYAAVWGARPLRVARGQMQLLPRVAAFACTDCAALAQEPREARTIRRPKAAGKKES